ncbi:cell division topological specificity factor [Oxobacter pfennigii]|uniref:Cell division topological specificity factor n=1 Tax=Oxobacter pfennigii TaxID=36849 RepID=A0A0P8W1F6_9CLOT|nr:cell division topological specificity factor MinE [Oxobacter pfennigii]KPU42242.1 cell division topological specificity factor [Oxobacter pfennigii]
MDVLKVFNKVANASKDVAKERLKLILIHDRSNIPPQFINMIKGDLIKVISDYVEIEEENIEITLSNGEGRNENISALTANIPIKKVRSIGK